MIITELQSLTRLKGFCKLTDMRTVDLNKMISVERAAEILRVSRQRIHQMIDERKIIAHAISPKFTLIDLNSLIDFKQGRN